MNSASAITQQELQQVSQYCETITAPARPFNISYGFKTRGNSIILEETRPAMLDKQNMSCSPVAKFQKNPIELTWELLWSDRNSKWHHFIPKRTAKRITTLLAEVGKDPTGIFFG